MNVCQVKYICLEDIPGLKRLVPHDFERKTCYVAHTFFDALHAEVFSHCPPGFKCVEPIALHHEVLWSKSLTRKGAMVVRDELHHALEEEEYPYLDWSKGDISLCVDIVRA
jgi:hypothetical protein